MKKKLVRSAKFSVGKGKSLIICPLSRFGLYRIVLENVNGVIKVRAEGSGSRFEFRDRPQRRGECDFFLGNPSQDISLQDYLDSKFWGQFNWSELFKYQRLPDLKRKIKAMIEKLAKEFESKAVHQLNGIIEKHNQTQKQRR